MLAVSGRMTTACVQKRLLPKATESDIKDHENDKQQPQDQEIVDLRDLTRQQRQLIVDNALATHEQSNEVLLEKYAARAERQVRLHKALLSLA